MDNLLWLFFIPAVIAGAFGSFFLKKGADKFSLDPRKLIKNRNVFLGLSLYGSSMVLYVISLRFGKLSVIYPLSSISYILVSFLSIKYLGEKMNPLKWIGIIFIIGGSFLLVIK